MKRIKPIFAGFVLALVTLFTTGTASADLVSDSRRALQQLVAQNPAAAKAKSKAIAILVFPDVVKAGFIVGAQGGQGILFIHGQPQRSLSDSGSIAKIWLCSVLDEPKSRGLGKQHTRLGDWHRPERRHR
jgi:hypothetical protein